MTRFIRQIVTIMLVAFVVPVSAQTDTTFTYQGRLLDGGNPASGPHDIDVSLWDAVSGGSQIGVTLTFPAVPVEVGLFTLELDFGANAFDNSNRWLELTVNTVPLSPRQPVTRAPYAIQTRGIFVDTAGNVGIGNTAPQHPLSVGQPTADGQPVIARFHSTGGTWNGGAAFGGATSSVIVGELGDVATIGGHNSNLSAWSNLAINPGGGNVGIGTTLPQAKLDVEGSVNIAGGLNIGGNVGIGITTPLYTLDVRSAGFRTIYARSTHTFGTAVFGEATAGGSTGTSGVQGRSDSTIGTGVAGWATANSGVNYGVLARSDSTSGFDFFALGVGTDYGSNSSIRWKSNIRNIDQPLEKVARLRGVYFDWDSEHGGQHDVGMIAEEVGKVLPEIVNYEENGIDATGMDYSKLTPLLVEAVNALRSEKNRQLAEKDDEIRELRAANAALESRMNQLEVALAQLAAHMTTQQGDQR